MQNGISSMDASLASTGKLLHLATHFAEVSAVYPGFGHSKIHLIVCHPGQREPVLFNGALVSLLAAN